MGNAVSMSKTPQAKDDVAATSEDSALLLDVLANDLGGAAKKLYSLDQSNPFNVATAALSQFGATIQIVDGKIVYDPTGSAQLQALAAGQTVVDTFSYAIRLGNGTLSIATVQITVNGAAEPVVNHAPVLASPIANQSFDEDSALSFTLPPGTFTDPDNDALTYTAALVGGAALPSWLHFDALSRSFAHRSRISTDSRHPRDGQRRPVVRVGRFPSTIAPPRSRSRTRGPPLRGRRGSARGPPGSGCRCGSRTTPGSRSTSSCTNSDVW